MISFLVLSALFISAQAVIDTNCTDGTNFLQTAINCDNVYEDASCLVLYPTAITTASTERENACFSSDDGTSTDVEVRDIAVASCPKTCGYCCLTKEWNCKNAERPRIDCSAVSKTMCKDPTWREIIAEDCPAACGFCLAGGCIDAAPDCHLNPTVCFIRGLETFVTNNCKRTCGLCSTSTTAATGTVTTTSSTCRDVAPSCASWVRNGFCTSTFYNAAQKRTNCARSCGLC